MHTRPNELGFRINLKPWLFCLNTLIFFPLLTLLLWRLGFRSIDLIGLSGLVLAIFLSSSFFKGTTFQVMVPNKAYWYAVLSTGMLLTLLYYFRLNFEFVDIHCPTNLLGFVSQLRRGHFPISFLAFPEFPANYHAGFPIISGYLSRWLGLYEYTALRFLSIALFFCLALGIQLFFLTLRSDWRFIIGVLVFFFAFSFPIHFFPQIQVPEWLKDTSIFDYFRSNSWPLTDITLLIMLFYFWRQKLNVSNMLIFACYTLLLAVLNASVHSLLLMTVVIAVIYEIAFIPESRKHWCENYGGKIFLLIGLLFLVRGLTHILPSAFMLGHHYRNVEISLRFLHPNYFSEMKGYFFQCGLLPWLALVTALPLLIQRQANALIRGIAIFFILTTFFPVIYKLNVTNWDNYHKFLLMAYYTGSILTFIVWSQAEGTRARWLGWGMIAVLIISLPNIGKMFYKETSWQPVAAYDVSNNDIIQFLKQQPADTRLLPYAKEGYVFCSPYTEVAAASGLFVADGYCYWFFTLSGSVEADFVQRQNWWKTNAGFTAAIAQLNDKRQFIIIKKEFKQDFNKQLQEVKTSHLPKLQYIEFKHFILVKAS